MFSNLTFGQITLVQEIGSAISPKSIVTNGQGIFAAQNMMYRHTITFYNAEGTLLKSLKDHVNLAEKGFSNYKNVTYLGAPVEACFTKDGKYLWVSNYAMYGPGFNKEGCDGCSGKNYDPSFLYKINSKSFEIESVVKVGSVPKFVAISPNGKLLMVSNWTSSDISIISLKTEKEIKRVHVGPRPRGVAIDNKNQMAYVAIMGSDKIAKINLLNFKVTYIEGVGKGPRHLILNAANTFLYVALNNINKLLKIDLRDGSRTYCSVNAGPRTMVMSANEDYLYVVNYYANTFQKVDTKTFTILETIKTKNHPIGITGNWKTSELWVACYAGVIQIFKDSLVTVSKDKEEMAIVENIPVLVVQEKPHLKNAIQALNIAKVSLPNTAVKIQEEKEKTPATSCLYHLISGSFQEKENALAFQKKLLDQGIDATIIKATKNQLNLVSIATYKSVAAANNGRGDYKKTHGKSSWIYHVPCK
ncbi:hypothetical protein DNU06_11105 [Putridiphycobacter roseus]|uniref:SPOR domain-containing protein n=1 Tax=Putridiphycobacter roseus TaxID=2219161 RepID=A0A2W1MY80_9FLAO|nr:hypothetical protein DNU06_11105 [Putridiphycobacter roseus]